MKICITTRNWWTKPENHAGCQFWLVVSLPLLRVYIYNILQKYSQNVMALNNKAAVLATTTHHNETISCYAWILKMYPKNANSLVRIGVLL
jgi:hypothetical protein